jgi:5-methylcytosine-specific restriction endonuclease McrA
MVAAMENRKVLVLNKGWTPVAVVPMHRAVTLLFSEYHNGEPKAKIIDPTTDFATYTWATWSAMKPKEGEPFLQAVNTIFRVPEVILLSKYVGMPQQRVHFSRRTIFKRDKNTCQYCGCRPGTEELTIEHVVPRCQGGITSWENCVLACVQCNSQKADRRPEEAFKPKCSKKAALWKGPSPMRLLSVPKKPKFTLFKGDYRVKSWEHFIGVAYWETELDNEMGEELPDNVEV